MRYSMNNRSSSQEVRYLLETLNNIEKYGLQEQDELDTLLVDQLEPEDVEKRKSVAKLVDPVAWSTEDFEGKHDRKLASLRKADQLIDFLGGDTAEIEQSAEAFEEQVQLMEFASGGATGASAIASVASPMGHQTISRTPSLFGWIKKVEHKKSCKKRKGKKK